MNNNKKLHWYCFSFSGVTADSGASCAASTYCGYDTENITLQMINAQKIRAGVTSSAVLVSLSRLGCMTKSEFMGMEVGGG